MKKLSLLVLAVALCGTSAFANPRKGAMDKAPVAGTADVLDGCGLGWQVTQQRTMLATTTRGTTNAFVPPSFGMTSGTIGCEQIQFAQNDQDGATYAMSNFENIRLEMAEGRGENLAAFAETMGCDAATFGAFTKANYGAIMDNASESPARMYMNVKSEMAKAGVCGA
jgi:hypothetical protein